MPVENLTADSMSEQFDIARDAKKMLRVFQESLQSSGDKCFQIECCRVLRFRYREGQRSILLYELRLRDAHTNEARSQWITGVLYADYKRAKQLYWRVKKSSVLLEIPDAWQTIEPVCYIPQLRMLVQVFPLDRYLDTLPRVLNQPTPELETLLLTEFGPGNWRVQRWEVEPTRYRPFLGVTLRCSLVAENINSGELCTKHFYIKLYRDDSGQQTYQLLRRLHATTVQRQYSFNTARPVGYISTLRALVLAEAQGQSLEQILIHGKGITKAMKKTARAMVALHQSDLLDGQPRTRELALGRAKRAGSFIRWAYPSQGQQVYKILEALKERLEVVDACPIHLDFKADHIFIDGDQTTFIDLDSFGVGDPVFDPATLLVRLAAMQNLLPISPSTIDKATQVFVDEYFHRVPDSWRSRLPVNIVLASLKVALYYVQHQEPNWQSRVSTLLNQATKLLTTDEFSYFDGLQRITPESVQCARRKAIHG